MGIRINAFVLEPPGELVSYHSLVPLELFEANGDPFMKVDTQKNDNAVCMRDGKPGSFTANSMVIPLSLTVKNGVVTYERRKPAPKPKKAPRPDTVLNANSQFANE